jgi:hypothetical protein
MNAANYFVGKNPLIVARNGELIGAITSVEGPVVDHQAFSGTAKYICGF